MPTYMQPLSHLTMYVAVAVTQFAPIYRSTNRQIIYRYYLEDSVAACGASKNETRPCVHLISFTCIITVIVV